jgi:hypothetical protein
MNSGFMSDFWSWLLLLLLMQSPCQHDHLAITIGTVVWSLRTSSSLNVQGAATKYSSNPASSEIESAKLKFITHRPG